MPSQPVRPAAAAGHPTPADPAPLTIQLHPLRARVVGYAAICFTPALRVTH